MTRSVKTCLQWAQRHARCPLSVAGSTVLASRTWRLEEKPGLPYTLPVPLCGVYLTFPLWSCLSFCHHCHSPLCAHSRLNAINDFLSYSSRDSPTPPYNHTPVECIFSFYITRHYELAVMQWATCWWVWTTLMCDMSVFEKCIGTMLMLINRCMFCLPRSCSSLLMFSFCVPRSPAAGA